MNREVYYWIVFAAIIIIVALYIRSYYQPSIALSVRLNTSGLPSGAFYEYQNLQIPIVITNTGGGVVKDMSIGVVINGNTTTVYSVTVPVGKVAVIPFNYTPKTSGKFTIEAVADPGKLYKISDRADAQQQINVTVVSPEPEAAYSLLNSNGILSEGYANTTGGALPASYFYFNNFSIGQFAFSNNTALNNILYPAFDIAESYIHNVDFAYAHYNGSSMYSIWISGFISPELIKSAAIGKGIAVMNKSVGNYSVIYFDADKNTSVCTWYSGGWVKILAVNGNYSCLGELVDTTGKLTGPIHASVGNYFRNITSFANYTFIIGNKVANAELVPLDNESISYVFIGTNDVPPSDLCYGLIATVNGMSFCDVYYSQTHGTEGTALGITTAFVGNTVVSAYSLMNTTMLENESRMSVDLIRSLNITGNYLAFTSGLQNSCVFDFNLTCSSVGFSNSTVDLTLVNEYNSIIDISKIGCTLSGAGVSYWVNKTLAPKGNASVTVPCLSDGKPINETLVSFDLSLSVNYTLDNEPHVGAGQAHILIS